MIPKFPLICLACTGYARADHGRDFLLLQDANVPGSGQWHLFSNYGWSSRPGPDEESADIGLSTGLFRRTAFTATFQYADDGGAGWGWNAATTALQFDLTPSHPDFPLKLGWIAGREFSLGAEPGHADDHEDEHEHETEEHEHTGIHQHGADAWFSRFVIEAHLGGRIRLAANLISLFPDDGENAFHGYAFGIRHGLDDRLALGMEITGDFDRHLYQEVIGAAYFSPTHPVTLKLGIGAGLTDASPDLSVRTGVVWKY